VPPDRLARDLGQELSLVTEIEPDGTSFTLARWIGIPVLSEARPLTGQRGCG
jgi:hypothetical protein